ncbi:MAG: hypothetical protein PVF47_14985 [Anaerolineae bacterium]|jgi:hypothetical protein
MQSKQRIVTLLLAGLLIALAVGSGPAVAQSSSGYNLEWHVIGGGGQPVTSASYALRSTAGQGAASPPYATSSSYVLSGGYWFGEIGFYQIYVPLVLRAHP